MHFISDNLYHIYNQGNNKQVVFHDDEDYFTFIRLMRTLICPHAEIVCYCLMPNHFHLIVYTDNRIVTLKKQGSIFIDPLSNAIRRLLSGYARISNKKYNRSGSVFRQKTKSKLLSDDIIIQGSDLTVPDYCKNVFLYVHQNPLKARLVNKSEQWLYSSFLDYAGLRNGTLCNKEIAARFCSYSPDDFCNDVYNIIDDLGIS